MQPAHEGQHRLPCTELSPSHPPRLGDDTEQRNSPKTATATCPPKKKTKAAHQEPTPQPRRSAFQAPGEHGPTQDKTKHIFAERPGRLSTPLPARRRGDGRTPGIFSRHSPREIAAKIIRGLHKAAEAFPTAQLRISAAPSPRLCPPHTIPNPRDPAGREQPDAGWVQPPYLGDGAATAHGKPKAKYKKMLHGCSRGSCGRLRSHSLPSR